MHLCLEVEKPGREAGPSAKRKFSRSHMRRWTDSIVIGRKKINYFESKQPEHP